MTYTHTAVFQCFLGIDSCGQETVPIKAAGQYERLAILAEETSLAKMTVAGGRSTFLHPQSE